jgi:hypothetical protein
VNDSVQKDLDTLSRAWFAEGRGHPLLWGLESVELAHFAARHGVGVEALVPVMRVLVEHRAKVIADMEAFGRQIHN